jgi:hypothetical protein
LFIQKHLGQKRKTGELLSMAITDFEPNEAAAIVLDYKLSDSLNEGQISRFQTICLLTRLVKNILK